MRKFWGELTADTMVLTGIVLLLLAGHVFLPTDDLITRLSGEGFAALLAFLRSGRRVTANA